jgi:hypothetical protein
MPTDPKAAHKASVSLPGADELGKLLGGLRPEVYTALAQVIVALTQRALPRKKKPARQARR